MVTPSIPPFRTDPPWIRNCIRSSPERGRWHRSAAERLRESERRFRELAEAMPFIVWTANPDGAVDYQTGAVMDFTGRAREELIGAAWLDIVHPADRAHTVECWTRAVRGGEPYGVEFRIRRRDGVYRWHLTRAVPVRNEAGAIAKWYGSSTDIHDIREGEARLRESEERFRVVARATADAIWDWDLRTDEIWWSEGLQRTFGVERDSISSLGSAWPDRIHPDDQARVMEGLRGVIKGRGEDWQEVYRLLRGDGAYARVVDRAFVIRDPRGTAVRMVGGMSDETHELEAQERIREQAQLLDRARDAILVLTDIMMPIMDGPATIRALLRMDPEVKIVAASGLGTAGGASAAESYGVREFINKPYNAETLLEVVGRVLAGGHRGTPGA